MRLNRLLEETWGDPAHRSRARREVRVFGSMARGEADGESDIDFLVALETGRSLMDLGGMQMELESLLGRRVDVVTARGLKARIRERVLRESGACLRTRYDSGLAQKEA
jgi:predicted nucleotidyltransferase